MDKDTSRTMGNASEVGLTLEQLIRREARKLIQSAIEIEVQELLREYANVRTLSGTTAVVRNGYLPQREILTAVGPVEVRVPTVRDRSGSGVKFNSALVPPYVRRSKTIAAALPWLYLKGGFQRRHARSLDGAGRWGCARPLAERGQPAESAVGQ